MTDFPQHDLDAARNRARDRMAELTELQQLAIAFAGEHRHGWPQRCDACKAERRIRDIAKTLNARGKTS